jgi:putative two-component system response regulator
LARILIVDDEPAIRSALQRLVKADGHVTAVAADAEEARMHLARDAYELVLCDVNMPGEGGLGLARDVLSDGGSIAVVMISGADDPRLAETALELGAYGYVVKPFREGEIVIAIANALRRRRLEIENRAHRDGLEQLVAERTAELQRSREDTIRRLARAAEFRDTETGRHIERVSEYSFLLATSLGLTPERAELLRLASPLHDIGKIAIPDGILLKPGRLSTDERRAMESHTTLGHALLSGSGEPLLDFAAELAWTHHEQFDGSGYPRGLAGENIPQAGRIVAVADVFDALTSTRVYRQALPVEDVIASIRGGRGAHFDPVVVDALCSAIPQALAIRKTHADVENRLRLVSS